MCERYFQNDKIVKQGYYQTLDGKVYDIKEKLALALQSSFSVDPDHHFALPPLSDSTHRPIIEVTKETTIACICRLYEQGIIPCALNFANGIHPGGGYVNGAHAQEEACCCCSALYYTLIQEQCNDYYISNQEHIPINKNCVDCTDWMIYSPDVPIFRDTNENFIPPIYANFITSPAICILRPPKIAEYDDIMITRIRKIIYLAIERGQKTIILGAFGCGAFHQDAHDVSQYFKKILIDENLQAYFDKIVFAIFSRHHDNNYSVFKSVFQSERNSN